MNKPLAQIIDGPEIGIPEPPALFTDTSSVWLSYETTDEGKFAIVKFNDVFDHWLSPINDEGLRDHPQFSTGLKFYSLHCISNSPRAKRWEGLGIKHWVVTFKDNTLDVLAKSVEVKEKDRKSKNASSALIQYLGVADHA